MLSEIKTEAKLRRVFENASHIDTNLFPTIVEYAFEHLLVKFKQDCFQFNGHANYLKMPLVLGQCIHLICTKMSSLSAKIHDNNQTDDKLLHKTCQIFDCFVPNLKEIMISLTKLLKCIEKLEQECLIYIEAQAIKKFLDEHFFRELNYERLMQFAVLCLNFIEQSLPIKDGVNLADIAITCDCLTAILNLQTVKAENANESHSRELNSMYEALLDVSYQLVGRYLFSDSFMAKNQLSKTVEQQNRTQRADEQTELLYAKSIVLGKFIEICHSDNRSERIPILTANTEYLSVLRVSLKLFFLFYGENNRFLTYFEQEPLLTLTITVLRHETFYFFAVTPHEIVKSFQWKLNVDSHSKKYVLPSIPIDYLNEAEIIEKFVRR